MDRPYHPLGKVRELAEKRQWEVWQAPLETVRWAGLDEDDLCDIICSDLGDVHFTKSETTRHTYPDTVSDYYSIWVSECGFQVFLKLLICNVGAASERLVITSFKKDDRHG